MKNIAVVFGTRPEAIKLAPVILELKKNPKLFNVIVLNTEQQKELSNQALGFFNITADIKLDVMRPNQSLSELQSNLMRALNDVYANNDIDATIVQGDTMTVFCAALVSFYHKKPVYHVEAGLRSYNLFEPFPEEAMRTMTARISDLHFCPNDENRDMLLLENIPESKILVTGNTVIDALYCLPETELKQAKDFFATHNIGEKIILVTVHRRENHGERLGEIISALQVLAEKYPDYSFVLPVHPNPNVKERVISGLSPYKNVTLFPPLEYPQLVYLIQNAELILTDSGGIQEEATAFGTPPLVLRYETERQKGVDVGFAKLVGADKELIIREADKVLAARAAKTPLQIYGDGKASERIVNKLRATLMGLTLELVVDKTEGAAAGTHTHETPSLPYSNDEVKSILRTGT